MALTSCTGSGSQEASRPPDTSYQKGSFGYDLTFLKQYDSVIVLKSDNENSQIIVSAKYQGKVFTSTTDGNDGFSFGWVNYKAFDGPLDAHMNAYGGENRLWLGPEGGRFSLYFKPGDSMVFNNWKTPAAFDTEPWTVTAQSGSSVTMQKDMSLVNYQNTPLQIAVTRVIDVLSAGDINRNTGLALDPGVKVVGYQTTNTLTNTGKAAWTETTGMPCIWMLDMMKNTPSTVVVVPYKNAKGASFEAVGTTNYFGEIPADRLRHDDDKVFFKADGKSRGKLGIKPTYTKPVIGSYDAENKILTIAMFEPEASAKYLNQEWGTTKPSFSGDAVNAYNDGPLEDGSQMGPFYEIESVSPAAFLAPAASLAHKHAVYHFTGEEKALDLISRRLLGVTLNDIQNAFK
ncbi:DUF6786 family protein [Foetidibacter luteolus]|uniref:DUF6786 family protein n=1 Tax=Foetidibacter luteolus TaxID=2608880 RepID=UPI001F18E0BA|nr:DUF6786 family protein [Foetidibacter luteolus]